MTRYRKKPIVVEAYDYALTSVDKKRKFLHDEFNEHGLPIIKTLEGNMEIPHDGFVIFGIDGEKYPCKRDIFLKTYEKVEEDAED